MEMIDVLTKLQEIAETKPELVKDAVENVEKTNPKEVEENAVESETPVNKEPVKEYEDKIQENVLSYKDFLAKEGVDIYKLSNDDYVKHSQGYRDHVNLTKEGGMSDVHIGAQEVIGEYVDDNGNLTAPKEQVLQTMAQQKAKAPFPESFEIETAMKMVADDFEDDGTPRDKYEPEPDDIPQDVDTQMNMDAPAKEQFGAKMHDTLNINGMTTDEDVISMIQDTIDTGKGDDAKDYLEQFKQYLFAKASGQPDQAESKELNTNTMTTEDKKPINESKKPVKEAITMSADTPQEAGMLMQIMKLAGVQQVTPNMIGAEEPSAEVPAENDADHDHDNDGQQDHAPQDCNVCAGDDEVGSNAMGQMRDLVTAPDEEKAEETWDNEPDEKVDDIDTLVNVHSGGLNRQKQQVRKEYPGDNPLAEEDKVTEEDLAKSLRTQYEGFKTSYQEAVKITEKKGKDQDKDGDVDSKDWKKSKDIAIKKAIADKK